MSNVVSSMLFCARSFDKAETKAQAGQTGVAGTRVLIATGQGSKVVDHVIKLDNEIGKTANTAVEALKTYSKSEKLLQYAGKAVDFAAKNVNPLICISAGVDVLTSDDKESTLIKNATGLSAMFAVEHLMKKHMDEIPKMKCMQGVTKKVMEFAAKHKMEGKLPSIIHGVAFVVGSCTAYSLGDKFGTMVANKVNN